MWFRRNNTPSQPETITSAEYAELHRRMGRLEASVESLGLRWEAWRDVGDRLVKRLERRDQRAAAKEPEPDLEPINDIDRRILARRTNALPR